MYVDCYGLDYIITEKGPVLLEVNSGPSLLVYPSYFNNDEEYYKQSVNRGYFQAISLVNIVRDNEDIEGISLYFKKGENDIQVQTIKKTLEENSVNVEVIDATPENKIKHKEGWARFGKLGARPDLTPILHKKLVTKKLIDDSNLNLLTPSVSVFTYEKDSVFPNLVEKPIADSQGKGIRFYKNSKVKGRFGKQEVTDHFFESYIECVPLKERLIHNGNGIFKKEKLNGEYVYDIRITIATYNEKWYPFFELKRIAEKPLPKKLEDGLVVENHYSYLTNLSQGSTIGFLEKDIKEKLIHQSISVMKYITYDKNVGKIKNIFWSGGQSSTYRIIELLLSGYVVNPYFLVFPLNGEKGVAERVITLNKLYKIIQDKLPNHKDKLLPINYVYSDDITFEIPTKDKEKLSFLDKKIIPLINYANQTEDVFEVCLPLLSSNNEKLKSLLNDEGKHVSHNIESFKKVTFPNIGIDKLNTYVLMLNIGYHTIIDQSWDCDNPIKGEICGKCGKCLERQVKLIDKELKLKFLS